MVSIQQYQEVWSHWRNPKSMSEFDLFDTNLTYSWVVGLMSSRDIQLSNLFHHELALVPTSMFDDEGEMCISKSKSVMKNKWLVEVSERNVVKPDAVLIDACALLWIIHWPIHGTVHDYVEGFRNYVLHKLEDRTLTTIVLKVEPEKHVQGKGL